MPPSSAPLPSNVHIPTHPCQLAKISLLRSRDRTPKETKALIHDITLILGVAVLARALSTEAGDTDETPVGSSYTTTRISPHVALVPILRSGLAMVDAIQQILPEPVAVHHLGLYREPSTLQPVEYYNNLPYHRPTDSADSTSSTRPAHPDIAILLDPIIATGGTSVAAIQTLLEWQVKKVVVISVLGSEEGVRRAAAEGNSGQGEVEIWVGKVDPEVDEKGMIRPGMGDVGDRLFLTIGK
ncbi:MAG: hypothetical protein LQ351_006508 [Letrouitia transgressa]|nr:MAG: hypothetical protein LQ351_006508 [Letrouitia transgressa]